MPVPKPERIAVLGQRSYRRSGLSGIGMPGLAEDTARPPEHNLCKIFLGACQQPWTLREVDSKIVGQLVQIEQRQIADRRQLWFYIQIKGVRNNHLAAV